MGLMMRLVVPESGLVDGVFSIWDNDTEADGYAEPNYVYNSTMQDMTKSIPNALSDSDSKEETEEECFFSQ